MDSECGLCGGAMIPLLRARDFESGLGSFEVVWCSHCEIGKTLLPKTISSNLASLYSDRSTTDFALTAPKISAVRRYVLKRRLSNLMSHAIPGKIGKGFTLLDLGCGDGSFAAAALNTGRIKSVTAVDFHEEEPALVKSLEHCRYESYSSDKWRTAGHYDLVVLNHVLEHSLNPAELVLSVSPLLAPGGILVVEVPNLSNLFAKVFGKFYFPWYVPRHITHFSPKSVRLLLDTLGLEIEYFSAGSTPVLGATLGNIFGVKIRNMHPIGLVFFGIQLVIELVSNSRTTIRVVAKAPLL